jgi:hypothetical protein
MHPARVCTEQLAIEHKRKPGQRVPVGRVVGGKSPDDTFPSQTVQNLRIFVYVVFVIIINKIKIAYLLENQQGAQYQDKIRENNERFFRRFRHN